MQQMVIIIPNISDRRQMIHDTIKGFLTIIEFKIWNNGYAVRCEGSIGKAIMCCKRLLEIKCDFEVL